jgi:hypothetical protein
MPERFCGAANPGCSRLSGGSARRVNASVSGPTDFVDVAACGRADLLIGPQVYQPVGMGGLPKAMEIRRVQEISTKLGKAGRGASRGPGGPPYVGRNRLENMVGYAG